MKKSIIIFLILVPIYIVRGQTFQDFINLLNSLPDSLRPAVVDSFMAAAGNFPFLEQDTLAHYIYNNPAVSVNVPGDANSWNINADPMTHISGTNFWYLTEVYEPNARLDYKFVLNGSNWILDPLNPHVCMGGFGPNSELAMPQYIQPSEIEYYPDIPHGALHDTTFYSQYLGNSRTIRVYLPPGYESSSDHYPCIIFHDGLEYITLAYANNVFDYLIYHQLIVPTIGVFIPPVNRTPEYAGYLQTSFTNFIVNEVIPWIDSQYRTIADPAHRATLGASYGGNIALHLGITHPETFGLIAGQSSWVEQQVIDTLTYGQLLNLNFYLDIGTYEPELLPPLQYTVVPLLNSRGYPYQFETYPEGHSWGNWRAHIDNALERFFPGPGLKIPKRSEIPSIYQNLKVYPNPFNEKSHITFTLPKDSIVSLTIYDLQGRKISNLWDGFCDYGSHQTTFDGSSLASGIYFIQLIADSFHQTQKLVLMK